jgi:peptidoglycan/xylan/chitin deacetylase (PgdA/CDA1 family)
MNRIDESRCGSPSRLRGVLLLFAAAILIIVQTVPAAGADGSAGINREKAPRLEAHRRGEPLDVLFLLPAQPTGEAFLVRFAATPENRRVVVCSLESDRVRELLERGPEFPSFSRKRSLLDLVGWINNRLRVPVHYIVVVKESCWPQCSWDRQVEINPILELAATYPGRLMAALPPVLTTPTDLLIGSLETYPGLPFRQVLGLLGEIETARENVELSMVAYDGDGEPPAVSMGTGDGEFRPRLFELLSHARVTSVGTREESPPGKFAGNCLVTFEPDSIRGKLPPAQLGQVIHRGNPALNRVAITIDDGWNADMRIPDLLQSWKIRYTAFIPGRLIDADNPPGLVERVYESGGEFCSHTYTHRVMRGLPESVFLDEIWRSEAAIARVSHKVYPYVRYAGGAYDFPSVAWAAREGFWVVNWTIDSLDTKEWASANAQVNHILSNLEPGAILLFHFGGYHTYEVLARVIPEIQRRGYEVTSLSRVMEGTPFRLDR